MFGFQVREEDLGEKLILGFFSGSLTSGTPFPCPPPISFPYFKGFWNGSGMGVVWVAGNPIMLLSMVVSGSPKRW